MTIIARYVALIQTNFAAILVGYGAVDSLTFVAIRDGDFNDPSIWLGGIVPFAQCSIVISVGITVSLARAAPPFPLRKFDIYGGLACSAGSSPFQFNYAINITVPSGGVIQDLTMDHFLQQELLFKHILSAGLGNNTTVNSASGPFTCGILPSGSILSFPRVTFIVAQSGYLTSGETFLGGGTSSNDLCFDGWEQQCTRGCSCAFRQRGRSNSSTATATRTSDDQKKMKEQNVSSLVLSALFLSDYSKDQHETLYHVNNHGN